ncbi:GGDEF domain-containing protein [Thiospirochaeta perfilievii]|uniref:diguanylate cyclase n=1 Tax=Thiospirochaeta perfilievii TaxID=252967 RepID=A0A5C1Q9A6_9SPIO|nr:ligand-binding sensor domain-containing diguanylate cyclase [Thiospirochaeta perfilievii]QEN03660.1 GGDEF domain-containing protein [Thiospirochaeta perfilievii]
MVNKKFYIFLIILKSLLLEASDTPYIFDIINKEQGLSSNAVSSIQQDSRGFLWLGTKSGLNYYDGYEFKVFHNDPFNDNSLAHDLVQTLYIDKDDTVWAGTYNGISRLDIATEKFTNYVYNSEDENSISNPIVTGLDRDNFGNLWIATLGGLNRLNLETGKIVRYLNNPEDSTSLMNNVVRSVMVDSKNRVWIGNLSGLDLYNPTTDSFIHYPYIEGIENGLPSPNVMKIIERGEDILYIGTWGGGVTKFNIKTDTYTNFPTLDNRIYTLNFDNNGFLWAGSWGGGISIIDVDSGNIKQLSSTKNLAGGISSDTIYSLFQDNTGIFWIGTNGGGLNKLNYQKQQLNFLTYNSEEKEGLSSGKIDVIFKGKNDNLWLSIYNEGLNIYNPKTKKVKHYRQDNKDPNSISSNIIGDIYEDSIGRIWLATNDGLNIYNPDKDNFEKFTDSFIKEQGISDTYTKIAEDKENNLWIGTYFNGLLKMDLDLKNIKHYNNLSDNLTREIVVRENGDIWIGTNRGLNKYNPETNDFTHYFLDKTDIKGINNNNIRSIIEDSNKHLWIGTLGGGVMRYNDSDNTFTHFTTNNGLSSNYVMSMAETNDNQIWIGTMNGVSIINILTYEIDTITKEDGLVDMEMSEGILVDKNKVYLGSFDTLSLFEKSEKIINKYSPLVYIKSVKLGNKLVPGLNPYTDKTKMEVDYADARYITFNFVGLSYLHPLKTEYSYKLEGFDKKWSKRDPRNFALYTNLSPGRYRLLVKAVNNDNVWSYKEAQLEIVIKPPFWKTWWAYLLYIIIILVFIYLLFGFKAGMDRRKRLLELEIINKKNIDLSIRDPLTGIYNRRYLKQRFDIEIEACIVYGTPISTLMLDIDNFKIFNDTHGHLAGDKCLISVVKAVQKVLNRPDDSFVRYGGEEFCILLPRTDLEGAKIIAENIRKSVEETGIVTVSIGVYTKIPVSTDVSNKLIKCADEALYLAKKRGKNRFEIGG